MATSKRWKYIEPVGFRPILFDKTNDPMELVDLGSDPAYGEVLETMRAAIDSWGRRQSQRTTLSNKAIMQRRGRSLQKGILIGFWDESELPENIARHLRELGRIPG